VFAGVLLGPEKVVVRNFRIIEFKKFWEEKEGGDVLLGEIKK